eukprot:1146661-Pelagomonas_calceolata.AAC.3
MTRVGVAFEMDERAQNYTPCALVACAPLRAGQKSATGRGSGQALKRPYPTCTLITHSHEAKLPRTPPSRAHLSIRLRVYLPLGVRCASFPWLALLWLLPRFCVSEVLAKKVLHAISMAGGGSVLPSKTARRRVWGAGARWHLCSQPRSNSSQVSSRARPWGVPAYNAAAAAALCARTHPPCSTRRVSRTACGFGASPCAILVTYTRSCFLVSLGGLTHET